MTTCLPDPFLIEHKAPVHIGRIVLPWDKPLISLNGSQGTSKAATYAKAAKVRDIQETVRLLGRNVRMPEGMKYLVVQFNMRPATNQRRDTDNLAGFTKPIFDSLAGGSKQIPGLSIVPDDTPAYMAKREPIIWPAVRGEKAVMWVDLYALENRPLLAGLD